MLKIKNLHKYFFINGEKYEVLKNINVEIKKGEKVVIIGPSGSGKSTFVRCINLLTVPSSGKIIYKGIDITSKNFKINALRKDIGMVFQKFNLFNNLTVLENITLAPVSSKMLTKIEAEKLALEFLDKVGLLDKKDAYPHNLSGGQQQRVAIVRSLAMKPSLMLFDEPTSALDPEMVKEVLNVIKDLAHNNGITMIIVTHEMNFAKNIGSRLLFMDNGEILEDKSPNEFFECPENVRAKKFLSKLF